MEKVRFVVICRFIVGQEQADTLYCFIITIIVTIITIIVTIIDHYYYYCCYYYYYYYYYYISITPWAYCSICRYI